MICWRETLLSALLLSALESVQAASTQEPLQGNGASIATKRRQLHGRFLQVTDFHPDPFYKVYSSISEDGACHRGSGPAGYYGAETSDCDSPISLINATFDWIRDELKDKIDFVIWTGDSARHDNDEKIPRNVQQVVQLNQLLVDKFYDVFGKDQDEPDDDPTNDLVVPVIPTFGNNDILPHNIFDRGPNTWTRRYLDVWRTFIPEVQKHSFAQGGWFYVEAIPNHLAVVSLNSLYFFNSNSAVDGCAAKSEPGYRQLDWLRIQLQYLRDRNMKAILTGHVPPARTDNKRNWDETCWQKYTLWMHQYRDVIAGTLYGHMNTDHFIVQDFEEVDKDVVDGYEVIKSTQRGIVSADEPRFGIQSATSYLKDLRDGWTRLPKPFTHKARQTSDMFESIRESSDEARPDWEIAELVEEYLHQDAELLKKGKKHKDKKPHNPDDYDAEIGGRYAERFSISHVSPSVVPNYFPTIRVYEYNITGLGKNLPFSSENVHDQHTLDLTEESDHLEEQDLEEEEMGRDEDFEAERKKKKNKKSKKHRFTVPKPPSKAAPPGPAYSPQSLTLLGFVQYYANLTRINNDFFGDDTEQQGWKDGKHHGKKPFDDDQKPHPKNFTYEVLYDTRSDKIYRLKDLTTRSYLRLAQRIAGFRLEQEDSYMIAEDEDEASSLDNDQDDLEMAKKIHKKKDKKKKSRRGNKAWYTFVQRAFVNTVDPDDIEEEFGPR